MHGSQLAFEITRAFGWYPFARTEYKLNWIVNTRILSVNVLNFIRYSRRYLFMSMRLADGSPHSAIECIDSCCYVYTHNRFSDFYHLYWGNSVKLTIPLTLNSFIFNRLHKFSFHSLACNLMWSRSPIHLLSFCLYTKQFFLLYQTF